MKSVQFKGETYNEAKLNAMPLSGMAKLYNDLTPYTKEKPVMKFSDKKAALRRVGQALSNYAKITPAASAKEKPLNDAGTAEKKPRKIRQKYFKFPVKDKVIAVREPSLRSAWLEELRTGKATYETLMAVTKKDDVERRGIDTEEKAIKRFYIDKGLEPNKADPWNLERRTYEGIRILHFYVGYGMNHDPKVSDVITLVEPKAK